jgi:hypothetical protein
MKTSKYFLFVAAFVVVIGLSLSAMAQQRLNVTQPPIGVPPKYIAPIVNVIAIETTDGTLGLDSYGKTETAFGYSFLGRASGSLPGSFTLSMNCAPAIPVPGDSTLMTGGSWTLPVYMGTMKGGGYAGSLYGTIAKGSMDWDKRGTTANVYIVLNVDGGTQTWDGVKGYATFVGTLSVDEKTEKATLTGDAVFSIVSPVGKL